MLFSNIKVYNFEGALRGMRNPKNSWHLSDSKFGYGTRDDIDIVADRVATEWVKAWSNQLDYVDERDKTAEYGNKLAWLLDNGVYNQNDDIHEYALIGPKDMKLAKTLIAGGSEHRKFLRQIMVSVDITAPLFWWKEFDTYKIGTTANSTSTMHKLTSKPITLDCFEIDDYNPNLVFHISDIGDSDVDYTISDMTEGFIQHLELLRLKYLETNDKRYWKELVRWLPESWLQTRTVTMNYENLLSIYHQRKNHKLTEWSETDPNKPPSFIKFIKTLPYSSDFITA